MSDEKPELTWEEADRIIDSATVEVRDDLVLPASPMVTIGILSFRHAATIHQAVESVLNQETDFPFEIVIADDDSDDGTAEILKEWQRHHPDRVRLLLARENLGRHTGNGRLNFIRLWRANRGRYFHLLDGDDWWTDVGKLKKQVDLLERNPDCALCWHRGRVVYDEGVPPEDRLLEEVVPPESYDEINDGSVLFWSNRCLTSSVLYRRGLCDELPEDFLRIRIGDWPLQILHARLGKAGFIDEVMSAYRVHATGMWSGKAAFNQVIGFMETMAQVHPWIPEEHRATFGEKLGRHLAYPMFWNKPYQMGVRPAQSLRLIAEILKIPGAEEAFVEQLELYRCEREKLSREREEKLHSSREKILNLKDKLEKERAKLRTLKEQKAKPRRWFHFGPRRPAS